MNCEWPVCQTLATHTVDIVFAGGRQEMWHVCTEHDKDVKKHVQRSVPLPQPVASNPPTMAVTCSNCGQALNEPPGLSAAQRVPCPTCGSTGRLKAVGLTTTSQSHAVLVATQKRPGRSGWLRRLLSGEFFSTFHGSWTQRDLDIDKQNDSYRERLVHHDGTVLVSEAKLSDHQGH